MIPVKTINYSKKKVRPVRNTDTFTADDMAPRKSEDNVSVWTLSDDDGSSWCCFGGGKQSEERPTQPATARNATQEKEAYERQQRMAVPQPATNTAPTS